MAQPPSVSNRDSGTRWILACGVGCGALLLIAVLGMFAGVALFRQSMTQMGEEIRAEAEREYTRLIEEERIPEEHIEVFDRIYRVTQLDNASAVTRFMGFFILVGYMEDGEVSESEANSASKIADFLEDNPEVGLFELFRYVEENPEFEEVLREVERSMNNFDPSGMEDHTDEPQEEPADAPQEATPAEESDAP